LTQLVPVPGETAGVGARLQGASCSARHSDWRRAGLSFCDPQADDLSAWGFFGSDPAGVRPERRHPGSTKMFMENQGVAMKDLF